MKTIASNRVLNDKQMKAPIAACKRGAGNLAAGFVLALVSAGPAFAGPTGGQVVGGEGSISQNNNLTQIDQFSQQVSINWDTFNVAANETVRFVQPDSTSVALNTIFDQNASQIFGTLDANGRVLLINPNGMIFAPTAQVNVAGLVASTLSISTADFMAGNYTFESSGAGGLVLNQGTLQATPGGFIALLGEAVSNEGLIVADAGTVAMGSGSRVALDFDGSGLMYFEVESEILDTALDVDAAVNNSGSLFADGGQVLLTSKAAQDVFTRAINNDGIVQARRISSDGGVIRLSASAGEVVSSGTLDAEGDGNSTGGLVSLEGEKVGLAGGAVVNAAGGSGGGTVLIGGGVQGDGQIENADYAYVGNGANISADALNSGDGGTVVVWAEETARVYGDISARGGAESGDGGFVETSGKAYLDFAGTVDASSENGAAGTWLLDPESIDITNAAANITQSGTGDPGPVNFAPTADDTVTTIDVATINTALNDGSNVTVTTASSGTTTPGDITVSAAIAKTADGGNADGSTLALDADNDIVVDATISSTVGELNVDLQADGAIDINADITTNGGSFTTANAANTGFDSVGSTIDTSGGTNVDGGDVTINASGAVASGAIDASAGTDDDNSGHTGGAVTLAGSTVSAGSVTTSGSAASGDGADGAGGNVTMTAASGITLNGNITTSGGDTGSGGAVDFNNNVVLGASATVDTGATAGSVSFDGTLNATTAFTEGLTVTAGTGDVTVTGATGGTAELGAVSVTSAGAVNIDAAFNAASLASTSATFNSAGVTIDTAAAVNDDAGAVNISATGAVVAGTIDTSAGTDDDNSGHTGGAVTLAGSTISAGSVTTSGSAASGDGADGTGGNVTMTAASGITLNGNITTSGGDTGSGGTVDFNNNVVLGASTTIDTGATGGSVSFDGTLNATTAFTEGLTVTAGTGGVTVTGATGGTAELGAVSVTSAGAVNIDAAFNAASLASTSATFDSAGVTIDTAAAENDDAGAVNISATGAVVAGTIDASAGTDDDNSGHTGGAVTLAGASVSAGSVTTTGSAASGGGTDGAGGAISLTANTTTITLNGNIDSAGGDSADGGAVALNGPAILAGNTTIDTGATAGNITFGGTVDGSTAFTDTLGLTAGTGNVAFNGQVGGTTELGAVTINSANNVDINGAFAAAALTSSSATFDSAGFSIATTPDGDAAGGAIGITTSGTLVAGGLTTTGGADADDSGNDGGVVTLHGASVNAGAITTTGTAATDAGTDGVGGAVTLTADTTTITLSGDIDTSGGDEGDGGTVTLNDPVVLAGGNRTINTGGAGGAVDFNDSLNGGAQGLVITAGSGQIDIGTATNLTSLDASTSGDLNVTGNVTTNVGGSGISLQADTVDIANNMTLDSNDEAISLISNTLSDGANSAIDAGTGTVTLAPLDTTDTIEVCTSGGCTSYDLDSYSITASTVQIGRAGQTGDIDIGTTALVGTEDYDVAFVNEDGDINIDGAIATTAASQGFSFDTTNGAINLDSSVSTAGGDITFASNVALAGPNDTVSTGAGAGNIDFQGAINGGSNLTVNAGSGQVDLGTVGGGTALSSLDVNTTGTVNLGGGITAAGNVDIDGTIELGGNDITINGNSGNANGSISLAANNGQVYGGGSLDLIAGTGDVTLGPVGQDGNPLSGISVTSADEVNLDGNVTTDTAGNGGTGMTFNADTVTLANTITLNSSGTNISFATDNFSGAGATINAGATGVVSLSPSDTNADLDLTVCDSGIVGSCSGGGSGEYDVGSLASVTAQEFQIGRTEHTGNITLNEASPAFDLGLRNGDDGGISVAGAFVGQGLTLTSGSGGIDVNASITTASGGNNDVTLNPGAATISLDSSIITNGNDALFQGDVVLDGNVVVNTSDAGGDGDVDFQGSINSPTNQSLTVNADTDGTVNFGDVGQDADNELATFTVTGNTINLSGDIETSGSIVINGQKNLLADVTLDTGTGAGDVDIGTGATDDGASTFDLTVTAGAGQIDLGATTVGSVTASTSGNLNVGGHISTNDTNSAGNGIALAGDAVALLTADGLDPTAGYDLVTDNEPIEVLANSFTDSNGSDIDAGSSTVTFAPLAVDGSVRVCDEVDASNDCAAGADADTEIDLGSLSITAGAVQIGRAEQTGAIATNALTSLGYDLALDTQGEATIGADYNSQALSVNADAGITLNGNVTTNGENATFADDVSLDSDVLVSTGTGNASFQGDVDGGQSLTVSATSGNVDIGNVGTDTNLTSLSVTSGTGSIDLGGNVTTTGDVLLSGTKVLSADVTIDNSAGAGTVTMSPGDVSNTDSESLTVNGGSGGVTLAGVSVNTLTVSTAGNATVGPVDNTGDVDVSANALTVATIGGTNIDLAAATGDITLQQVDAGGTLTVTAAGNIVGGSRIDVTGAATFDSGGDTTLSDDTSSYSSIDVTAVNATVLEGEATTIAGANVSGNLTIDSGGAITGTGALTVGGNAVFDANDGASDITLNDGGSTYGSLSLTADNATVAEDDGTDLAALDIEVDLVLTSGGDITDSGTLDVRGNADLSTDTGSIVLDQPLSTFGSLTLDAASADVTESGDMLIDGATIDGSLALESSGDIVGTGIEASSLAMTADGEIDVSTTVGSISLTNNSVDDVNIDESDDIELNVIDLNGAGSSLTVNADGNVVQSENITTNSGSVTIVATGGSLTMGETVETFTNGGDITYRTTGNENDITLGLLQACDNCNTAGATGDIRVEAGGNIVGQPRLGDQPHITGVTAFLQSGGQIGSDPDQGGQQIVFDGMSENSDANPDDSEVAPIHLEAPNDSFVNTNFFLFTSSGRVFNQSEGDRATAASAQAAALEEEEDVDWAAYSEDITVYEINNEGIHLPDAGEADEFVMIEDNGVNIPGASSDDD